MEVEMNSLNTRCSEGYISPDPVYINLTAFGITYQLDISPPFPPPVDPTTLSPTTLNPTTLNPTTLSVETTTEIEEVVTNLAPENGPHSGTFWTSDSAEEIKTESTTGGNQEINGTEGLGSVSWTGAVFPTSTPIQPVPTGIFPESTVENVTQNYELENDTGVVPFPPAHPGPPHFILFCVGSLTLLVILIAVLSVLFCRRPSCFRIFRSSARRPLLAHSVRSLDSLDFRAASASEQQSIAAARGWRPVHAAAPNLEELRAQQGRLRRTTPRTEETRRAESSCLLETAVEVGRQREEVEEKEERKEKEGRKDLQPDFAASSCLLETVVEVDCEEEEEEDHGEKQEEDKGKEREKREEAEEEKSEEKNTKRFRHQFAVSSCVLEVLEEKEGDGELPVANEGQEFTSSV